MDKIQYKCKIIEENSKDYFILFLLNCGFRNSPPPQPRPKNAFLNFVLGLLDLILSWELSLFLAQSAGLHACSHDDAHVCIRICVFRCGHTSSLQVNGKHFVFYYVQAFPVCHFCLFLPCFLKSFCYKKKERWLRG